MIQKLSALDDELSTIAIPSPSPRSPSQMMGAARVAAAINNPLSFARTGMRELLNGGWRIIRDKFDLDAEGRGEVLYRLTDGAREYHFYLLSNKLPEEQKLDRNFAGTWEAMGVLCEGDWTPEREARLRIEIPKQVTGRADYDTLIYVRGNRSGRLFQYVVDSLAAGRQPDPHQIASVGYILRTTAFIGNGQLGTRPLAGYDSDHPMRRPYHAQIWSAFLLREYVFDLVEHMARANNPQAARLNDDIRRYVGLGNSAATGLVPFVANHPLMIHRWVQAQESAAGAARSRSVGRYAPEFARFQALLTKAIRYFKEHDVSPDGFFVSSRQVAEELETIAPILGNYADTGEILGEQTLYPWLVLQDYLVGRVSPSTVEVYNAIVLELYPDIVDQYIDAFMANERRHLDPTVTVGDMKRIITQYYDWVLELLDRPDSEHYFWYRAEAAPFDLRRGIKGLVPELESETSMDTVRLVREMLQEMEAHSTDAPVLDVLMARPDLRQIVRRVQSIAEAPYGELRVNLLDKNFSPFGPVRFVLSFYGMEKFEGALPKVVRGAFLQGAPIARDVEQGVEGSWPFPLVPAVPQGTGGADIQSSYAKTFISGKSSTRSTAVAEISQPTVLQSAPVELRRLIQGALHGAGLEYGEAIEMAETVLFHEITCGEVDSYLPTLIGRAFPSAGSRPALEVRGGLGVVDAREKSALALACTVLDWVSFQALTRPQGVSAVLIEGALDTSILNQMALRCAERGLVSALCWRAGKAAGFAIAGSGAKSQWIISGRSSSDESAGAKPFFQQARSFLDDADKQGWGLVAEQLASTLSRFALSTVNENASRVDSMNCSIPGDVLLVCAKASASLSASVYDCLSRRIAAEFREANYVSDIAQLERQWDRYGISIDRSRFDDLANAARRLLVPDAEEHRLRPDEVIDPLKIF